MVLTWVLEIQGILGGKIWSFYSKLWHVISNDIVWLFKRDQYINWIGISFMVRPLSSAIHRLGRKQIVRTILIFHIDQFNTSFKQRNDCSDHLPECFSFSGQLTTDWHLKFSYHSLSIYCWQTSFKSTLKRKTK